MREFENNKTKGEKKKEKRKKGKELSSDPYHSATRETKALLAKFMSLERSWLKSVEKYLHKTPLSPQLIPNSFPPTLRE